MLGIGKKTEEPLEVLDSRPSVDLGRALARFPSPMAQSLSLVVRLCFHDSNCRCAGQLPTSKGKGHLMSVAEADGEETFSFPFQFLRIHRVGRSGRLCALCILTVTTTLY